MMARSSRFRIPPPSDWILLGRPAGEWVYLAAMAVSGASSLRDAARTSATSPAEWGFVAGQLAVGISALLVVAATVAGWRIGLRMLWLWLAAVGATTGVLVGGIVGAPSVEVILSLLGVLVAGGAAVWYGRRRLHAAVTRRVWPEVLAEHAAAADEFTATIGALTPAQWTTRRAPEAWSPAEITDHLARTYSQYAGEARGKNSLRIRLRLPMLLFARAFVKPRLLRGAPFPKAKAPRPLRPGAGPDTPADGVALFRATGAACLRDLGLLAERRPYRQLVHPYLGALPLYDMVRFAAQHIRHHHRQVLAAIAAPPAKEAPHVIAP
jgi:hypothetical protein